MSQQIGFIGLGMMGKPMAMRLLGKGFPLHVYNRTRDKATDVLEKGAIWCESPRVVMEKSSIVISMVADSQALEEISIGSSGLLEGATTGKIHIDMSTVLPTTTERLEQEYQRRGAVFLHAPVLGSVPHAAEGQLLIFVGGNRSTANRCESIFSILGRRVWYFDEITKAGHLKLICNLFIASMITALSEGLVLSEKAGVPSSIVLEVLKESALNAPMYQTKGESIRERNFTPRFLLTHMLKDANLILESAQKFGLSFPTLSSIRDLFAEAHSLGLGGEDYSAIVKVLEKSPQSGERR